MSRPTFLGGGGSTRRLPRRDDSRRAAFLRRHRHRRRHGSPRSPSSPRPRTPPPSRRRSDEPRRPLVSATNRPGRSLKRACNSVCVWGGERREGNDDWGKRDLFMRKVGGRPRTWKRGTTETKSSCPRPLRRRRAAAAAPWMCLMFD